MMRTAPAAVEGRKRASVADCYDVADQPTSLVLGGRTIA